MGQVFFFLWPTHTCNQTQNPYFLLDAPIILNTTYSTVCSAIGHFLNSAQGNGCTFKGCSPIQNGCSIIEKHLVMGVLTLHGRKSEA